MTSRLALGYRFLLSPELRCSNHLKRFHEILGVQFRARRFLTVARIETETAFNGLRYHVLERTPASVCVVCVVA